MIDEGYAAIQILSQVHDVIIEEKLGDKQKSVITEKMAVSANISVYICTKNCFSLKLESVAFLPVFRNICCNSSFVNKILGQWINPGLCKQQGKY